MARDSAQLGYWGSLDEHGAWKADLERAMSVLGPLLVDIFHRALGGPPPRDPTFGLVPLAQSSVGLSHSRARELFRTLFAEVSTLALLSRRSPTAPVVDWEAAVDRARADTVGKLAQSTEAESAGALAGKEAAKAALDALVASGRLLPARPRAGDVVDEDETKKKKHRSGKKERERVKRAADKTGAAAPSAAPAAAGGPAAAPSSKSPRTYQPDSKRTLTVASAGQIQSMQAQTGQLEGVTDALQRLFVESSPSTPHHEQPCSWMAAKGECKGSKRGTEACRRCAFGAKADPAVLKAARALISPRYLSSLPDDTVLKKA